MALPSEGILAYKDPKAFRTNRVVVCREDTTYFIDAVAGDMNFEEMLAFRKTVGPSCVFEGLEGAGHVFANLGVSAVLTLTRGQDAYLLAVRQIRRLMGGTSVVAKLVSGYVDASSLADPHTAMLREIAEEILPFDLEGRLVALTTAPPGDASSTALTCPFASHFSSAAGSASLFPQVVESPFYSTPGAYASSVVIGGRPVTPTPSIYFHSPTNSVQLVFNYHIDFGSINLGGLCHAEEAFDSAKKQLSVRTDPRGVYFFRLEDRAITGEVFVFGDGKLKRLRRETRDNLLLSEAFASHERGLITKDTIPLPGYLRNR